MALLSKRKKYRAFGKLSSMATGWLLNKGFNKIQKKSGAKLAGKVITWAVVAGAAVGSLRYFAARATS